jgi:class 3 adenylate cyclase
LKPVVVAGILNDLYTALDIKCAECNCVKIDTIGDAYIAHGGLEIALTLCKEETENGLKRKRRPNATKRSRGYGGKRTRVNPESKPALGAIHEDDDNDETMDADPIHLLKWAQACADTTNFALKVIEVFETAAVAKEHGLQVRIGLHTGLIIAGVIGVLKPKFTSWGKSVEYAQEMEQSWYASFLPFFYFFLGFLQSKANLMHDVLHSSLPNKIQMSDAQKKVSFLITTLWRGERDIH